LANGQLHGPGNEVNCYECHGPHGHFPDCLNHDRKCHGEEECQRDVDHAHRQCSGGGAEVHGTCQICCTDDMCVGNAVQTLQGSQVGLDLHCPADCSLENLADCITRGHRCLSGQFCQVSIDKHNGHLHGHCENNDKMQLDGDQCQTLDSSKSCGLCSLFNHTDCKDTVPNNGCVGLQATDDVCNKNVAIDICPVTCNMCDRWIDMKINEALANGQITGVTGPTMSPTAAPSFNCQDLNGYSCSVLDALCTTVDCPDQCNRCTVAGLTCDNIREMNCGVLDAICPLLDCPDVCDPCFKPIENVTTTATADVQTDSAPEVQMGSTPAPSGMSPVSDSTVAVAAACADTLDGMDCSSVVDVCSSPLLANYCPKFCGLCLSLDHHCPADCTLDDLTMCITRGHRCISGQDQLEGDQCRTLDESKSCGLCSLFNHTDCKDTVPDNGCVGLQATDDVCNKDVAIDICPVTCNMCSQWIDMKVKEALANGNITGVTGPTVPPDVTTDIPMDTTTMAATTGAPSGLTCDDIQGMDCSVLDALCPLMNCPDACAPCCKRYFSVALPSQPQPYKRDILATTTELPTTTVIPMDTTTMSVGSTGAPSGLTCDDIRGMDCSVLSAICPLVDCPDVCAPCTQWIDMKVKEALANGNITGVTGPTVPPDVTTDIPMDTTTMAATTGASSGLTCDDIQGMDCSVLDALCPLMNCPDACAPCCKRYFSVALLSQPQP
ncbi:hypothetical protein BaRGS_00039799, partial [Batillaria attramentaria]